MPCHRFNTGRALVSLEREVFRPRRCVEKDGGYLNARWPFAAPRFRRRE